MKVAGSKEGEVYEGMTRVLSDHGFVLAEQPSNPEDAEVYAHPDRGWDEWANGDRRIHITRTASWSDPLVAYEPPHDWAAWNPKGLSVMLQAGEESEA
jgi:hypothetical protein